MFAPIMHTRAGVGILIVGKIVHKSNPVVQIPLTQKEVKAVCDLLNNLSLLNDFMGALKDESVSKGDDGKGGTDHH